MSENIRQRKRLDESTVESSKDENNRGIVVDQDERRSRYSPSIPIS